MHGISLVTIRVSDVDRSLRFYRDQLGLKLIHVDGSFHEFDAGPIRLAIDQGGTAEGRKGPERCPIEIHLHVDSIAEGRTRLEASGIRFAGPSEEYPYGRFARFYDPDGNPLVLFEPGGCPMRLSKERVGVVATDEIG